MNAVNDDFYALADERGRNWEAVLVRLLASPRTRAELRRRLRERGCPCDETEGLLNRYEEAGLIDDSAYAELYIDSKRDFGVRRLRDELRARGVDHADIEDALERCGVDETERACALAERWRRLPGMTREKLLDRLRRRGFGGPALRDVSSLLDDYEREEAEAAEESTENDTF